MAENQKFLTTIEVSAGKIPIVLPIKIGLKRGNTIPQPIPSIQIIRKSDSAAAEDFDSFILDTSLTRATHDLSPTRGEVIFIDQTRIVAKTA